MGARRAPPPRRAGREKGARRAPQVGDVILAINGVPVQGLTLDAIKGLTIGPEGSPVQVDFEFC